MTTEFDRERYELERLEAMGRTAGERKPSPRLLLTARMLAPSVWAQHAQEHIDWCTKHRMMGSSTHFGTQFALLRRLSLIRARLLLRALDRQAAGLPDLPVLDARDLSKRMEARAMEIGRGDRRRYVSWKAARALFFLKSCDGLPAPEPEMADTGAVTLVWTEGDRTARIDVDPEGAMTLTLDPSASGPVPIEFNTWNATGPRRLAAVTDWVHFGGPEPVPDEAPAPSAAA